MKNPEVQEAALFLTYVGMRHARAYPKYNQAWRHSISIGLFHGL